MSKYKLYIFSRGRMFECAIVEPVVWETHRKGQAGKLTFDIVKDEILAFHEGDAVRFEYDSHKIFIGFVFTKKRSNNRIISVTAYDQLRYFKNKDTHVYKNKTAAQVLQMLAKDCKPELKLGIVADTKYVIPIRDEDNAEFFTIMDNALVLTAHNTGKTYVLYDDFGQLNLRDINTLRLDLLVDEDSGESFEYTSSIDDGVYNKIKLTRENKETGKREVFIAQDSETIGQWGMLMLTESLEEGENGKTKADALLKMYNKKTRKLHMNGVFGDVRVRGGSIIGVQLYLGDITVANFMLVDKVKHSFYESKHQMDLTLIGGEFIA